MFEEMIRQWREFIATKRARINALLAASCAETRVLSHEEAAEHDTLLAQVTDAEVQLQRLVNASACQSTAAVTAAAVLEPPVDATPVVRTAASAAPAQQAQRRSQAKPTTFGANDRFQGQSFTRLAIARVVSRLENVPAHFIARQRWPERPELEQILAMHSGYRASDVAGGGSNSPQFGSELVSADNRYTGDFIDFLYSQTVFDQLPLTEAPEDVTIKGQDGASTAFWVGEGAGIPMTNLSTSAVSLTPLKVATLTVVSKELLRRSSPAAEVLVRDSLVKAAAQRIDGTFVSTTIGSAGVSPAGILYNVDALSSYGPYALSAIEDLKQLVSYFITQKNSNGLHWVMNKSLALSLAMLRFDQGQSVFPNITQDGGSLLTLPVVTGDNVNANHLVLCKPSDIWKIGARGITVDLSTDATIEMATNPSGDINTPVDQSQAPVNMFQEDSVAIKIVQPINFQKRRSTAVMYIDDADYQNNTTA